MICARCGVDHELEPDAIPPLYDVDKARREMRRARRRRDNLTRAQVIIGDRLAHHLDRHFSAEELETAGRAVMIAAASVGALAEMDHMQPAVLCNVLAFAGDRLITDGQVTTGE